MEHQRAITQHRLSVDGLPTVAGLPVAGTTHTEHPSRGHAEAVDLPMSYERWQILLELPSLYTVTVHTSI